MSGFRRVADLDIGRLAVIAPDLVDEYAEDWRKTMPFSPHRDTDAVFVRSCPTQQPRDVLHSLEIVDRKPYALTSLREAVEAIAQRAKAPAARVLIARLKPGGKIDPHTDIGTYAARTERYHLPIITNVYAWLQVGAERRHLAQGELWWIDKSQEHSGSNDGDEPRYHLVVDVWKPQ